MRLLTRAMMLLIVLVAHSTVAFSQDVEPAPVPPEPKAPVANDDADAKLPRAEVGSANDKDAGIDDSGTVVKASANLPRSKVDLVIENPEANGGVVHFLFESKQFSLKPGEKRLFTLERVQPIVRFHRGAEFGNANYQLFGNHYRFVVSKDGWELDRISPPFGRALNP